MVNQYPEVLNDFRAYNENSNTLIGIASVELPSETNITQEVSGVGVNGKISIPVQGQYENMETKISWKVPTEEAHAMSGGKPVALEFRGAIQMFDSSSNMITMVPTRIVIRGRAGSFENGKYEQGTSIDALNTITTTYLKIEYNGKRVREIDKYGSVDYSGGTDLLAPVRKALGI